MATIFWLSICGVNIGATWRIRWKRPCAAAMRPYVKLLWPLVIFSSTWVRCVALYIVWEVSQEMVQWAESAQWSTKLKWCRDALSSHQKVLSGIAAWMCMCVVITQRRLYTSCCWIASCVTRVKTMTRTSKPSLNVVIIFTCSLKECLKINLGN